MMYDYLVVGSGLYGAIFAHEAKAHGKSVLVVDKRPNIAGNIYTENIEGINVHKYGAHIFHTNNKKVWNYITQFAEFNRFTNSPVANYKGELYSLPFNMYTFNKMWGVVTPEEAAAKIEEQRKEITGEPKNLEEQAISLVGRDIYEKLIKGYTEKQWGRDCKDLPAFIIKRLPVRLTFDNNYFNIPNLKLSEQPETSIGKYGRMRKSYLKEHRPILYNQLLMSEKLYPHLLEIDWTAQERVDTMLPHMMEAAGVTEELKACDPMRWVGLMNTLTAQIEEILIRELICS